MNERFRSHQLERDHQRLDKSKDYNVKNLSTEEKKLKHMLHTLERQKEFSKNYGKKLVEKLSDQRKKKRFDPLDLQKMTDEEKQKYKEERKLERQRTNDPAASFDVEGSSQAGARGSKFGRPSASIDVPRIKVDKSERGNELGRIIERKLRKKHSLDQDYRGNRPASPRGSGTSDFSEMPDLDPSKEVPNWMKARSSVAQEFAELLRQNKDFLFEKSGGGKAGKNESLHGGSRRTSLSTGQPLWKQLGDDHDEELGEFMKKIHTKYGGGEEQLEHIQQYYQTLCEQEAAEAKSTYGQSAASREREKKKNAKKKMLALEAMLQQLPTNYATPLIEPDELLACRYLRLSNDNVEELIEQIWEKGIDPGIHAHMTEKEVENFYEDLEKREAESKPKPKLVHSSVSGSSAGSFGGAGGSAGPSTVK